MATLGLSIYQSIFSAPSQRGHAKSRCGHASPRIRGSEVLILDYGRSLRHKVGQFRAIITDSYNSEDQGEQGFPLMELPWDDFSPPPAEYFAGDAPVAEQEADSSCRIPPYSPQPRSSIPNLVLQLREEHPLAVREAAVRSLWSHCLGGAQQAADVAAVPDGVPALVTLLASGSPPAMQAAAGVLGCMAGEEAGRLVRAGAAEAAVVVMEEKDVRDEVLDQAAFLLGHLASNQEEALLLLSGPKILSSLLSMLASSSSSTQQSASACLRQVARREGNLEALLAAGAIPVLTRLVLSEGHHSKAVQQNVRSALTDISTNPVARAAIQDEGVLLVPLIGPEAYRSVNLVGPLDTPSLYSDSSSPSSSSPSSPSSSSSSPSTSPSTSPSSPSLSSSSSPPPTSSSSSPTSSPSSPSSSPTPSPSPSPPPSSSSPSPPSISFGASSVLAGLRYDSSHHLPQVDEEKGRAVEAAIRTRFLARIGVLEKKEAKNTAAGERSPFLPQSTVMPHWDAIPRLVLILGLEDAEVGARAAEAITLFAACQKYASALRLGGAVGHLVRLLGSGSERATLAAATALRLLAESPELARSISCHVAVPPLLRLLQAQAPPFIQEQVVAVLCQLARHGQMPEADGEARQESITPRNDPRHEIVAAGGLPLLLPLLTKGSIELRCHTANLCAHLAQDRENVESMKDLGMVAALKDVLSLKTPPPGIAGGSVHEVPKEREGGEEWLGRAQEASRQCATMLGG